MAESLVKLARKCAAANSGWEVRVQTCHKSLHMLTIYIEGFLLIMVTLGIFGRPHTVRVVAPLARIGLQ